MNPDDEAKATFWDHLTAAGLSPDSATASTEATFKAGTPLADAYDHYVHGTPLPQTGTPGVDPTRPAQAFFDHLADATTFGLGKKAMAAVQSLAGHGDMSSYASNLAQTNQDLSAESAANHKTSIAGSVAGAVVSPINKLLAPLGLLGGGAVGGALIGSGNAKDDLSSQVMGAGVGGAAGLAGSGVLGGLLRLAGPSAGRQIVAAAANDPRAAAELDNLVQSGRGPQAVLADLSPKLRGILDRAATKNPDVMEQTQDVVNGRQPDAASRVRNDMVAGVGGNPHLAQIADQMKAQRLAFADSPAGFQGLRDANPALPVGADLSTVLSRPGMKDALAAVQKADELSGTNVGAAVQKSFGNGGLGLTAMPSTKNVSYTAASQFERALDGQAGKAYSAGNVPLAQAFKTLRNGVGDFLEQAVPEHAQVKATYAGMKGNEEALQAGAKFYSPSVSKADMAYAMSAMTPAQQNAARQGLASEAISDVTSRATNLDPASKFANASEDLQAKLETMFGSKAKFDQFAQQAKAEQTLGKLRSVVGGSQTAARGADESADMASMGARAASSLAHGRGMVSTLLHTVTPQFLQQIGSNRAAQEGNLLLAPGGSDAITQLLGHLQNTQQTMGLLTQGGLGAGAAGANLSGGLLQR